MAGTATGTPPAQLAGVSLDVPVAAVYSPHESDRSFVWVIDEQAGSVSQREVEVGQLTATGLQILGGLKPGELIATAGVHYLREGQRVRPLEPKGN